MADSIVRTLTADELVDGARLVGQSMLVDISDEVCKAWAELFESARTHGSFTDDGHLAGITRWFASDLSVPGGAVPAGLVTAVAVSQAHRRQGHLSRLMRTQLDEIAAEGRPVATLVSAEWPIYGRFGYGPSVEACSWRIDALTATFLAEPTGSVELVDPAALRPHLEALHDVRWARTPGAVTRESAVWDVIAGVAGRPGQPFEPGTLRGTLWRDGGGAVRGAVGYRVKELWADNRPRGTAEVNMLVGATPEAERELWRHLCDLDWVASITADGRGVDDPLPLFLYDARAAVQVDRFDCIWSRILDVPGTFGAYRPLIAGHAVVDVVDDLGFAAGRWRLDLGPDGSTVQATTDTADVRLPVHALGAAHLGGTSVARLHEAGWLDEEAPGGVARLGALLATPTAPWSPTTY